jgi:hypothetical protein
MFLSHIFITTTTTATMVVRDFLNCFHPSFMFVFLFCVCARVCACFMSMLSVKDFCVPCVFGREGILSHVILVGPDIHPFIWFFCSHSFIHLFSLFPYLIVLSRPSFVNAFWFLFLLWTTCGMLVWEVLRSIDLFCFDYGVKHLFLRKVLK